MQCHPIRYVEAMAVDAKGYSVTRSNTGNKVMESQLIPIDPQPPYWIERAECRLVGGRIDCQMGAYYRYGQSSPPNATGFTQEDGVWHWVIEEPTVAVEGMSDGLCH
jgi:hypothetical protein